MLQCGSRSASARGRGVYVRAVGGCGTAWRRVVGWGEVALAPPIVWPSSAAVVVVVMSAGGEGGRLAGRCRSGERPRRQRGEVSVERRSVVGGGAAVVVVSAAMAVVPGGAGGGEAGSETVKRGERRAGSDGTVLCRRRRRRLIRLPTCARVCACDIVCDRPPQPLLFHATAPSALRRRRRRRAKKLPPPVAVATSGARLRLGRGAVAERLRAITAAAAAAGLCAAEYTVCARVVRSCACVRPSDDGGGGDGGTLCAPRHRITRSFVGGPPDDFVDFGVALVGHYSNTTSSSSSSSLKKKFFFRNTILHLEYRTHTHHITLAVVDFRNFFFSFFLPSIARYIRCVYVCVCLNARDNRPIFFFFKYVRSFFFSVKITRNFFPLTIRPVQHRHRGINGATPVILHRRRTD